MDGGWWMVAQWDTGHWTVSKLTFCYFSLRGRKGAMTNDCGCGGGDEVAIHVQ